MGKTKPTDVKVSDFIDTVAIEQRREDAKTLVEILTQLSGEPAYMFGPSIIGFGTYHYKYASGTEGDAPLYGFSPRKDSLALYFEKEFPGKQDFLSRLGKHKAATACVYVKKLSDIDLEVFKEMTLASAKHTKTLYPDS